MKGLILNNLYTVEKSIKSSTILAIAVVIGLMITKTPMALKVAIFLPFLLVPVHAFEVLKHDAMSGWNKFELTLPLTRKTIITSKYVTFLLLFILSALIVSVPFLIAHVFIFPTMTPLFFNFFLRGMGLILCMATLTYPLTYILGTEKSDTVTISSVGFSLGMFFLLSVLLQMLIGTIEGFDEIFSVTFLSVSILLLVISYFTSNEIYKRKEF